MNSYLAIIQARMGSTRLPGKVMLPLNSKPVLWHVMERVKLSGRIDKMVVATTDQIQDNILSDYVSRHGVDCFRGSETDVLDRFYRACEAYPSAAVVRVTADNPLVDPKILDDTIGFFEKTEFRYVKTRGFPVGIGAEVFKTDLLKEAFNKAKSAYEREHVTPYMYTREQDWGPYVSGENSEHIRLTIDTEEDYRFMRKIYMHFYKGAHDFFLNDILDFLKAS